MLEMFSLYKTKHFHLEFQHEKSSQWASTRGVEEGGCDFRLKKTRIYVELQLQINPCSRRVVNTGRWILEISALRKIF